MIGTLLLATQRKMVAAVREDMAALITDQDVEAAGPYVRAGTVDVFHEEHHVRAGGERPNDDRDTPPAA